MTPLIEIVEFGLKDMDKNYQ